MSHWFAPIHEVALKELIKANILDGGEPWMQGPNIGNDNYGLRFPTREAMENAGYLGWEIP